MKYRIDYSKRATVNLENIVLYIAQDNPSKAIEFFEEITARITMLSEFPYIGNFPPEDNLRYKGKRLLVFGNYKIYYAVDEHGKRIKIATVRHGARKPL